MCGKHSALRVSDYHRVPLAGRCLSTGYTPEETARHLWSTILCMWTERDKRNVSKSWFSDHRCIRPTGERLNSLGHCFSADLEGVAAHSPQSVDGVWICHCLQVRANGWCAFHCFVASGLSQLTFPASRKMTCPGRSTPREGIRTQIYAFPYACDILTVSTHHRWLLFIPITNGWHNETSGAVYISGHRPAGWLHQTLLPNFILVTRLYIFNNEMLHFP